MRAVAGMARSYRSKPLRCFRSVGADSVRDWPASRRIPSRTKSAPTQWPPLSS